MEFFYISNRYSKVNKKYLKSYDPKQESKHVYLDANNLYGYAMSKFLPTSGFKWIDPKDFDLNKCPSNCSKGCVLEVDLEYPKELRELHINFPLAPDKTEIKRELLSDYQLKIADLYNTPIAKAKYVIHYEKLQLKIMIEAKNSILLIRIQSIPMAKTIC